jgi:hypothetical protein
MTDTIAPEAHPICQITLLQTGTAREFYARVESGESQLVTGPWETRDALMAYVARWLSADGRRGT